MMVGRIQANINKGEEDGMSQQFDKMDQCSWSILLNMQIKLATTTKMNLSLFKNAGKRQTADDLPIR